MEYRAIKIHVSYIAGVLTVGLTAAVVFIPVIFKSKDTKVRELE